MLFELKANTFFYILTYKNGQDHLELLFNCVRGKLGFNNNPDVREFQFALSKILLRAAFSPSRHSNCLLLDEDRSSPILSLKWSKKVKEVDCLGFAARNSLSSKDLFKYFSTSWAISSFYNKSFNNALPSIYS